MKDCEFIELLNLYLDHEIRPADAVRLEMEIQRNPRRRATYLEYCRMEKACRIVAAEFTGTPVPEVLAAEAQRAAPGGLFERRRPGWQPWVLGAGGLFAAASLALVAFFDLEKSLGTVSGVHGASTTSVVRTTDVSSASRTGLAARPMAAANTPVGTNLHAALLAGTAAASDGNLALSFSRHEGPGLRLVRPNEDQLEWVRQFQMVSLAERNRAPLPRFEVAPASLRPDVRAIRLIAPADATEEVAAFRFLK